MTDSQITDMNRLNSTLKMRAFAGGLFVILLLSITIPGYGQQSDVRLVANPANGAAPAIKNHILQIRQSINHPQSWKGITLPGNHPAIGVLNHLIDTNEITSIRLADTLHLLSHSDDTYEVREIYVKTAHTDTLEHRALSLTFNRKAELTGVQLLPEIYNYQLALDRKVLASAPKREAVITQVRRFQEALINIRSETISTMLTPDAHIVKGGIDRYFFEDSFGPFYKYTVLSAERFVNDITDKNTPKYNIQYSQIDVYQFPNIKNTFVATFQQQWTTGEYRDNGYVAMVINLDNNTSIPLRVWQEEPFKTGYLEPEISSITSIPAPTLAIPHDGQKEVTFNTIETKNRSSEPGFVASNKHWLLMGIGASAAITVGSVLLSGSGDSELPAPPGRPALH